MLRVLLWRASYEILCLLKILGFRGPSRFYFAFGANLNPGVLEKRKIDVLHSEYFELSNHRLRFNHDVPFRRVGFASVESFQSSSVPGMIYEIPWIDEKRMDCFEAHLIMRRYLKSWIQQGDRQIFFYQSSRIKGHGRPTLEYRNKILSGYLKILHSEHPQIQKIKSQECIHSMTDRKPIRFLFESYDWIPYSLRHLAMNYDYLCFRLFKYFIFKDSLFHSMIPNDLSGLELKVQRTSSHHQAAA